MAQDNHLDLRETFVAVAREGHEEMNRPSTSLFWSAVAAGLLISFSLLFKALLRAEVHGMPTAHAIESFGYTIGFVFVILARLQLFTENTISPVLPTISVPSRKNIYNTGRVWVLSLTGNLVGTCLIALLFARTAMVPQIAGGDDRDQPRSCRHQLRQFAGARHTGRAADRGAGMDEAARWRIGDLADHPGHLSDRAG